MSEAGLKNLQQIARVLKSNGTEGGILAGFRGISPEELEIGEPVFIYFDGLPVPFFITGLTPRGTSKAIITFDGVNCLKDSEELVGKDIFIDGDLLENASGDDSPEALVGWTVLDERGGKLGEISGFEDIPGNPCIYIRRPSGEEILAPLHEDFILALDPDERCITLELPAGLA